jgi:DNA-binding response OmpR family regulator/predicted Ser/Thr protein kinase
MATNQSILLINRDKYFLKQTAAVLQESGYAVHTAMEMRGALSALAANPIGLIICDKSLQDISGYDFLSFIKKDPLRENIPFMFFVSLNDQDRPLKSFQLGAIDYLVYPIDPAALTERIAEAFSLSAQTTPRSPAPARPQAAAAPTSPSAPQAATGTVASTVIIDLSRDGVIWMPAKILNFNSQGLSVETALFVKTGVALMLRLKRPEGTVVINGRIKEIAFADFQNPARLEIEVDADESWNHIYEVLMTSRHAMSNKPAPAIGPAMSSTAAPEEGETTATGQYGEQNPEISCTTLLQKKAQQATYDIRFYQSLIGKQLDNYRAITFIGAGNMGGVLQGWDVALEREVALKIISYELSSKEKFREMFIKEARVVSRLNHPNIAHIYHIGSCNEILYYAMEFIEGISLKEVIQSEGPLAPLKALDYLVVVCNALETVYQNSIVHRDIKPANIMLCANGNLKIVDFGVAKHLDLKSKGSNPKALIGSPLYMSPEQIAGLAIDHRSDMYSVGITFYHALSGSPPFNSEKIKEILFQHLKSPVPDLSKTNDQIPTAFSKIIGKMMAKDPKHRYSRFKDIAEELKGLRPHLVQTTQS